MSLLKPFTEQRSCTMLLSDWCAKFAANRWEPLVSRRKTREIHRHRAQTSRSQLTMTLKFKHLYNTESSIYNAFAARRRGVDHTILSTIPICRTQPGITPSQSHVYNALIPSQSADPFPQKQYTEPISTCTCTFKMRENKPSETPAGNSGNGSALYKL
jgi:hypothetical protein